MNRYNFRGNIDINHQGNIGPLNSNIEIITSGNLNIGNIISSNITAANLVVPNIAVPLIPNSGIQKPYKYQRLTGVGTSNIVATPPVGANIIGYFGMIHNNSTFTYYPIARGTTTLIAGISVNAANQLLILGSFSAEPYDLTILITL